MQTLILDGSPPLHWALAGLGIGAVTLALLFVTNRRLGISTGFESLCSLVVKSPYFRRSDLLNSNGWRLPFLGGLVLGGFVAATLAGGWAPVWQLGMFDTRIGWGPVGKVAWMFAGGLFIGFGTRLSGGCTSGHGIFGLSNFEIPSLKATISFMVAGIATTTLVYRATSGM